MMAFILKKYKSSIRFFLLVYVFCFRSLISNGADTTKIIFFQDSNIQQFRGVEWHRIAQKIPKGNYSKAILQIDLGCATYGCCAWDYTYRGFFSQKINDSSFNDIEVARLITPYSSFMRKGRYGYDSTWVHPYLYDVTDYLPLLRWDSVFYSASTGGWDDKGKFGFKHTVTLYLIKGDTLRNPVRVIPAFQDNYRYHDSAQMDSIIQPFKFRLKKGENFAKLRTIITGHDQEGEFSPIYFYVKLNGKEIYQKRLWKTDCDKNPIQPQSGTWIFSRTNWCPGEKVNEIEAHLPNLIGYEDNEIEIVFGKIQTDSKKINALYSVESHIITYGYKDSFDIALVDIISPSRNPNYRMYNPTCSELKLLVKNEGTGIVDKIIVLGEDNQSLDFRYNYDTKLMPYQSEIFTIPVASETNYYKLTLEKNNQNRNTRNDIKVSNGLTTNSWRTKSYVFEIVTTNDSSNNVLVLRNGNGDTVLKRDYFNNNTTYRDTIQLVPNCYHLELFDYDKNYECGDGLSFWYSSRIMKKTSGLFKIYDANTGELLKVFNPDFGGKINYEFRTE